MTDLSRRESKSKSRSLTSFGMTTVEGSLTVCENAWRRRKKRRVKKKEKMAT
jgi:hypothetical protein